MLRSTKIILLLLVALWGLLGGMGNLFGYSAGHAQVMSVMAREGAYPAGGPFIAMSQPLLTHLGYAVIWLGKLLSGALCLWGSLLLWQARNSDAASFHASKSVGLVGCGVALIMLFGGFVVAGGVYFGMWASGPGALSHQFASQYVLCIGVVALFISARND